MITLQALYEVVFQEDQSLYHRVEQLAKQLGCAGIDGLRQQVKEAHNKLFQAVKSMKNVQKMKAFDVRQDKIHLFHFVRHCMRMVMDMISFIRAVNLNGRLGTSFKSPRDIHQAFFSLMAC